MEHIRVWRWNCFKKKSHGHSVDSSIYFGCLPKTPLPKMPTFQNISGVLLPFLVSQHPGKPPWAPRKAVARSVQRCKVTKRWVYLLNFGPAMKFNEDCNLTCDPMVHRWHVGRGLELGGGS